MGGNPGNPGGEGDRLRGTYVLPPKALVCVSWSWKRRGAFRAALVSVNHLPVSTIERSQPRSRHEQQETEGGGGGEAMRTLKRLSISAMAGWLADWLADWLTDYLTWTAERSVS